MNRTLPTNMASVQKGEHFVVYFIYLDIVSQTHRLKLSSCLSLLRTWNHGHTPRLATRMDGKSRQPPALLTTVSPLLAKRLADRNHSGTHVYLPVSATENRAKDCGFCLVMLLLSFLLWSTFCILNLSFDSFFKKQCSDFISSYVYVCMCVLLMCVLLMCVHMSTDTRRGQRKASDPLELELHDYRASDVIDGNRAQALWKSIKPSYLLSHLAKPRPVL